MSKPGEGPTMPVAVPLPRPHPCSSPAEAIEAPPGDPCFPTTKRHHRRYGGIILGNWAAACGSQSSEESSLFPGSYSPTRSPIRQQFPCVLAFSREPELAAWKREIPLGMSKHFKLDARRPKLGPSHQSPRFLRPPWGFGDWGECFS